MATTHRESSTSSKSGISLIEAANAVVAIEAADAKEGRSHPWIPIIAAGEKARIGETQRRSA